MKTLAGRLMIFLGLLLAIAVGVAVWAVRETYRAAVQEQGDQLLRSQSFALSRLVDPRMIRIQAYIQQGLGAGVNGLFFQVFDSDGQLVEKSANLTESIPLSEATRKVAGERTEAVFENVIDTKGNAVRIATFARTDAGTPQRGLYFYAQAGMPLVVSMQRVNHTTVSLIAGGTALWALGIGGLWLMVSRWRRPLRSLIRQMQEAGSTPKPVGVDPSDADIAALEAALNRLLEQLASTHAAQQQFVADASHELRTPLAVMLGENDVALRRERSAEEYREMLRSNREEVARLSHLVDNLLTLARQDAGEVAGSEPERFNLHTLCGEVCDQLAPLAEKGRVTLTLGPAPESPIECTGRQAAVYRAVFNLVDNALAACPAGESVSVDVSRDGANAVCKVTDTGVGIASEHLGKIFNRFYRTDAARKAGGAGLGLAIVKSIVEGHGGYISVQSKLGQGSTFTVRLPVCA